MRQQLFPALTVLTLAALLVLGLTTASPAEITPLPPVQHTDGRAGACYSFYYDPPGGSNRPFIPLAYDAGSRWDRFDFDWPNLEPEEGNWNAGTLQAYDSLVQDLSGAGIESVGILLWTPDWAATSGLQGLSVPSLDQRPPGWYSPDTRTALLPSLPTASSSPPRGLYEEWNDWTATDGDPINYWGRFVHTIVEWYDGDGVDDRPDSPQVTHWEMWNEPEWSYFWTGTSTDYAQLLKVGYLAARDACPDCTILFGGLHYWANPNFYRWVLNTVNDDPEAPANNYFFDVMSVHLYSRSSTIYDVVNDIRQGMLDFVPQHPIWLTETGVPVWDDAPDPTKYDYAATQQEAAAYVIQSYANSWAAGVERYFFFRTNDAEMTEYFGLVRNDHSLRPAYVAYQVATTYMVTPTMSTRWTYGNGVRRVTLWGTPRGKLSVLWNTTPATLPFGYEATLPTATLIDRWGVTQTIVATGGVYSLTLPGATANLVSNPNDYFIGGEPYLVLERDTTPPTITITSLPSTTYAYTIPVSWASGDDAAGVWGVDVQVREGATGSWADWLSFAETAGETAAGYAAVEHGKSYCFRARSWDRAGNISAWSAEDAACTMVNLEREIQFELAAVYGDENENGLWDTGEISLTQASFSLLDATGTEVVTPAVGSSWEFTATLTAGEYTLRVVPEGWWSPAAAWLPRWLPVTIDPGLGVQQISLEVGLSPRRASSLLPLLLHGYPAN